MKLASKATGSTQLYIKSGDEAQLRLMGRLSLWQIAHLICSPHPPDLQPASLKDLHAGAGSPSLWNRGFSSLESGVGNASRVEQTEIARVCTIGRHPEGQKDWEPAGKQIDDIRLQRDMAAIPEGVTSRLSCPDRTLNPCPVRLAQQLAVQGHWHTDGRGW